MVDTTIDPIARIEPPFAEPVPDKTTPDVHSQPWNDFFTKQAGRVADLWTRMAAAEYAILHMKDGVTDGSDALPGIIGEYLTATGSGGLTSGAAADIATLTLAAGDWDVAGSATLAASAITVTFAQAWLSTAANSPTDPGRLAVTAQTATAGVLGPMALVVGPVRYSVTASTGVHLGCHANFPAGTSVTASAFIRARRVR